MSIYIDVYELIFINSYRGHTLQGEEHGLAIYSAALGVSIAVLFSVAALLKGLMHVFNLEMIFASLTAFFGLNNGPMSLIIGISIVATLIILYFYFNKRFHRIENKFANIWINKTFIGILHMLTPICALFIFVFAEESALILIIIQTLLFSLFAKKSVEITTYPKG